MIHNTTNEKIFIYATFVNQTHEVDKNDMIIVFLNNYMTLLNFLIIEGSNLTFNYN